jgi:hypothetical protein
MGGTVPYRQKIESRQFFKHYTVAYLRKEVWLSRFVRSHYKTSSLAVLGLFSPFLFSFCGSSSSRLPSLSDHSNLLNLAFCHIRDKCGFQMGPRLPPDWLSRAGRGRRREARTSQWQHDGCLATSSPCLSFLYPQCRLSGPSRCHDNGLLKGLAR